MNETQVLETFKKQGWTYTPDPTTWTGGTWYHNEYGSVNQGGGSYPNILDALAGLTRFLDALEQL